MSHAPSFFTETTQTHAMQTGMAVSPSFTNCTNTSVQSSTSVTLNVLDCSAYSSPEEMLAQDIEYPCVFKGLEGCNGKVRLNIDSIYIYVYI